MCQKHHIVQNMISGYSLINHPPKKIVSCFTWSSPKSNYEDYCHLECDNVQSVKLQQCFIESCSLYLLGKRISHVKEKLCRYRGRWTIKRKVETRKAQKYYKSL